MALMSQPLPPKSFGAPVPPEEVGVPIRVGQAWIGAVGVKLDWKSQLVAHEVGSNGDEARGSPVFHRNMPASCHPPRTASTKRLPLLRKALPLPNGICHTTEALMRCRMSKWELAEF